jgi:hypothetical protein
MHDVHLNRFHLEIAVVAAVRTRQGQRSLLLGRMAPGARLVGPFKKLIVRDAIPRRN